MALKHWKSAFTITKMQIKPIWVYHFLPIWQKAKSLTLYCAGKIVDKQALSYTAGENLQSTHMEYENI